MSGELSEIEKKLTEEEMKELDTRLADEGFDRAPRYGWKKVMEDGSLQIVIEPGKDTRAEQIDEHGLRPHDNTLWESVLHLGFVDGSKSTDPSLLYRFWNPYTKQVEPKEYGMGAMFYSIYPSGFGSSHLLINASNKPIRLSIKSRQKQN
jgi:hypothetical protein